ncbi:MAG: signal peptidase II [Clostridia bacterium]|nr:signal peptidase II [Clostridia bacterium]
MFKKKLKPQFGKLGIILLVVIAVLIASDLLTKFLEEKFVWNAVIIPNFIVIKAGIRNQGCAFSFLDDNPEIGQPVLITLTFILLIVLLFGFIFLPNRFVILKVAISMLIAGAIGNLIDRLAFFQVRDWFGLNMFGRMAFCNFADFWIVLGAVLAVVDLMFLNEFAVFPLTKAAKAAQKAKKEEEEAKKELINGPSDGTKSGDDTEENENGN